MTDFVTITDRGDSDLMPGDILRKPDFGTALESSRRRGKVGPSAARKLIGLLKLPLYSDSFLYAA